MTTFAIHQTAGIVTTIENAYGATQVDNAAVSERSDQRLVIEQPATDFSEAFTYIFTGENLTYHQAGEEFTNHAGVTNNVAGMPATGTITGIQILDEQGASVLAVSDATYDATEMLASFWNSMNTNTSSASNSIIFEGFVLAANDTVIGTGQDDTIDVSAITATLRSFATRPDGNDTIDGGDGNDTIAAGSGQDTVRGGSGNDEIFGDYSSIPRVISGANNTIRVGQADELYGENGDDTIYGRGGNDLIDGGDGNDIIFGDDGADTIVGSSGNDEISGGNDDDTIRYEGSAADYDLSLSLAGEIIVGKGAAGTDTLLDVEFVKFGNDPTVHFFEELINPGTQNVVINDSQEDQILTGNADNDVFVIFDRPYQPFFTYQWAPTADGTGTVVSSPDETDILYGFETIRFEARTVAIGTTGNVVSDDPSVTQHLQGVSDNDIFVVNGNSADYGWGPTEDFTGTVIWSDTGFDVVQGFEAIRFNDTTIALTTQGNEVQDDPAVTQHLLGTVGDDVFIINGNSGDYQWAVTENGSGTVVWNDQGFDVLHGFEEIRFNDQTISISSSPSTDHHDDPTTTQHLTGADSNDRFIIDGNSADYQWGPTEDGSGVVVWNNTGFDILSDFEELVFNDTIVDLEGSASVV